MACAVLNIIWYWSSKFLESINKSVFLFIVLNCQCFLLSVQNVNGHDVSIMFCIYMKFSENQGNHASLGMILSTYLYCSNLFNTNVCKHASLLSQNYTFSMYEAKWMLFKRVLRLFFNTWLELSNKVIHGIFHQGALDLLEMKIKSPFFYVNLEMKNFSIWQFWCSLKENLMQNLPHLKVLIGGHEPSSRQGHGRTFKYHFTPLKSI